jgi:hypothetical protein
MTQGDFDRYRHLADAYSLGLHLKLLGLGVAASLNWERILFVDPLGPYPSRQPIANVYHRYGRVALELGY